jgi:uncharacterized protein YjbI with pentapeptide repeats
MMAKDINVISETELLRRYQSGQRQFCDLDINSDGTNALVGAHIDGIELIDCFITASFRGASMQRAIVHSNMKTCDFSNADLSGSDFRNAALCATTFVGANMRETDFTGAFFHSHELKKGEVPHW